MILKGLVLFCGVSSLFVHGNAEEIETKPSYRADCGKAEINGYRLPQKPTKPTRYDKVTLVGCKPNFYTRSYAKVLRQNNIIMGSTFELLLTPGYTRLSADAMDDIPPSVTTVVLTATDGVLVPERVALSNLDHVRTMTLENVRSDGIPKHLDRLTIVHADYFFVPEEVYNVVHLKGIRCLLTISKQGAIYNDIPRSVTTIVLTATDGVLVPERVALSNLDHVRTMTLENVRSDGVPKHLDRLTIVHADYFFVPEEVYNVVNLKFIDSRVTSMAHCASRLQRLYVSGNVTRLPFADHVTHLTLTGKKTSPAPMLKDLGDCIQGVLFDNMERLELSGLGWSELPARLLLHAPKLVSFNATGNYLHELRRDLFSETDKLRIVDLSDNLLSSLPSELFSGLRFLHVLNLQSNKLKASDLKSVLALSALTELRLSGNPLTAICADAVGGLNLNRLQKLKILGVSRIKASCICPEWLLDMPALEQLDMEHNEIRSIACQDLRGFPGGQHPPLVVNLAGNSIDKAHCSQDDVYAATEDVTVQKVLSLKVTSKLVCDCDSYWLSQWLQLNVSVEYSPAYAKNCTKRWHACPVGDDAHESWSDDEEETR